MQVHSGANPKVTFVIQANIGGEPGCVVGKPLFVTDLRPEVYRHASEISATEEATTAFIEATQGPAHVVCRIWHLGVSASADHELFAEVILRPYSALGRIKHLRVYDLLSEVVMHYSDDEYVQSTTRQEDVIFCWESVSAVGNATEVALVSITSKRYPITYISYVGKGSRNVDRFSITISDDIYERQDRRSGVDDLEERNNARDL